MAAFFMLGLILSTVTVRPALLDIVIFSTEMLVNYIRSVIHYLRSTHVEVGKPAV